MDSVMLLSFLAAGILVALWIITTSLIQIKRSLPDMGSLEEFNKECDEIAEAVGNLETTIKDQANTIERMSQIISDQQKEIKAEKAKREDNLVSLFEAEMENRSIQELYEDAMDDLNQMKSVAARYKNSRGKLTQELQALQLKTDYCLDEEIISDITKGP